MSTERVADDMHALLFAVRKSRRYHMHFELSYSRWDTFGTFLTALTGSATAAAALGATEWVGLLSIATAVVAAFVFSLRTTARALLHREFSQKFTALEIEIRQAGESTDRATFNELLARRLEIEMKEPPPVKSVNLLCHNEEVMAGGFDPNTKVPVPMHKRLIACLFGLRLDFIRDA